MGAPAAQAAIEEVVVTATKRTESTQDIPVSVNALNGDEMTAQGTSTFLEYVQYLPNVVKSGRAPGRNDLYIRGSATEQGGTSVSSVNGTSPAVALYLDEQPVAFGGRNLDVYAADLTRVEVLPGPQGTLFGASSQAGTVRLITNKPDHTGFSAGFDSSVSTTKGGELSNSVEAFLNMPLTDALAVRIVGYNDYQGGWIDNVPGTFTPSIPTINRNQIAFGSGFRPQIDPNATLQSTTNGNLVEDDQNDATYKGARIGVSYDFNADWNILVQHTEQQLDTEGVFDYDPHLDEESVQRYTPNENEDAFGLTTWTVEGRARGLDIIYTGGYLDREVDTTIDYTGYNNGGGYIAYYLCNNDGGGSYDTCFDPTKTYVGDTENTRMTHEFRISTPQENRWRVTAGLFLDDIETTSIGQFNYASTGDAFGITPGQVGLVTPGANAGGVQFTPDTTFVNDFTRQEDQLAIFGEVAFDLMPDLTFTAGARYYEYEVDFKGASNFAFGCKFAPGTADAPLNADGSCNGTGFSNDVTARLQALGGGDIDEIVNLQSPSGLRPAFRGTNNPQLLEDALNAGTFDISDFDSDGVLQVEDTILKFSLDYRVNEQLMLFGTYSEGFRPPGVNRNAGQAAANQTGRFQGFIVPARAETDELTNYELGFKGDFLDRTLRFNATAYYSEITDLQTARFDPANVAFLVFLENVGDAEVRGIDGDFTWLPTPNLTISGAFSFIQTEITDLNPQLQGIAVPEGSELPYTPEFSGNIRARYDFDLPALQGRGYVRAGVNYRTDSFTGITGNAFYAEQAHLEVYGVGSGLEIEAEGGTFASPVPATGETFQNGRYVQEGYALVDLAAGIDRDGWTAELFMQNAFDEAGDVFITANNSADFTPKVVPTRPRTIGLRVSYDAF
ncbi:MAG: TonB-dependent receptor [Pseudomonadales bacterium]|nr:TonB-dependent receptor [Pseudomonadales bacterium]